jgi:hypothetical protein
MQHYKKIYLLLLLRLPTMDPLMLITLCSTIKDCYQWEAFDKSFSLLSSRCRWDNTKGV